MLVLAGFAVASLVLAGVGLYGTLAYLTSQRTQEFGVRLALGASAASILRLVIREGGLLTGLGAALGLAGATVVTRVLRGLPFRRRVVGRQPRVVRRSRSLPANIPVGDVSVLTTRRPSPRLKHWGSARYGCCLYAG